MASHQVADTALTLDVSSTSPKKVAEENDQPVAVLVCSGELYRREERDVFPSLTEEAHMGA
jgi:hypothetical protein